MHKKFQYASSSNETLCSPLMYDIVGKLNIYYLNLKFLALLYSLMMDLMPSNLSNFF